MAEHDHGMATEPKKTVEMASVHRPGDEVVELPAGATADQLGALLLNVVEMPDVGVQMATVHRPGDEVVEFPAGKCFEELKPADFKVVDLDP